MTSSLFATTLFASFFVVVLPHVLPCPAPRITLADGEMEMIGPDGTVHRRRRRRRIREDAAGSEAPALHTTAAGVEVERGVDGMARFAGMENSRGGGVSLRRRVEHECPIPKPGGVVGELLGFRRSDK